MKLDFSGRSTRPTQYVPNYLVGRDRRKLGYWVFGIGLLVLMAFRFGDVLELTTALAKNRGREPIDTRAPLPAYREPLPHGAVYMPLDETNDDTTLALAEIPGNATNASPTAADKTISDAAPDNPPRPETKPDEPAPADDATDSSKPKSAPPIGNEFERLEAAKNVTPPGYAPGVDLETLKHVKDKSPLRDEEIGAWYHLFDVVNRAPTKDLAAQATPIKTFRILYEQSNYYRGRPITLQGDARWYREHKADANNAAGIAKYYEIGVQMDEAEDNPIFVYCSELPGDWPRGKVDPADPQRFLLKQPMKVTGVGYKNFGYSANDTLRYAPLMIAQSVQVAAAPAGDKKFSLGDVGWPLIMLFLGFVVMVPLLWAAFGRRRTPFTLGDTIPRIVPPSEVEMPSSGDNLHVDETHDDSRPTDIRV